MEGAAQQTGPVARHPPSPPGPAASRRSRRAPRGQGAAAACRDVGAAHAQKARAWAPRGGRA
eukprot:7031206-Prymnesium_polylepis.1